MADIPCSPTSVVAAPNGEKKQQPPGESGPAESSSTVITRQNIQSGANQPETMFRPIMDHGDSEPFAEKPFPFMKLPPELQNMIFKEAFCFPFKVRCFMSLASDPEKDPVRSIGYTSRGLRTSKAFYNNAMPVYFHSNTFLFNSFEAIEIFLGGLNVQSRRSIRSVGMILEDEDCDEAARLLRGCVSLRRLSITIPCEILHYNAIFWVDWARYHGIKELLRHVRGIEELEVFRRRRRRCSRCSRKMKVHLGPIIQALQGIKQPYTAAALRVQDKKDFVWGKANVTTRSMQGAYSSIRKA
ncbi:MAG: hypothetical protein Q9174_001428 [Haloplaca sp. 1 TL-2023]